MKVKITLDKRTPNLEGKYPIILSFSNFGKTSTFSFGIYVSENEFDKDNQILFLSNKETKANNSRINTRLTGELAKANAFLLSMQIEGKDNISPVLFKELFLKKDNRAESKSIISFNSYFHEQIKKMEKRTGEIYESTLNKIEKYYSRTIQFEEIDKSWIDQFVDKMKQEQIRKKNTTKTGLSINTQSLHLRNIRAIINNAIDDRLMELNLYPFRKYKIKSEETEHRNISVEKLRELFNFTGTRSENWAGDVAKLIFFLIGINASDLYDLDYPENGRISYRRNKTGRLYSIFLEPEATELIEKFKGENHFLCFQEQFSNAADFLKKINGETIYDKKTGEKKILKRGLNTLGDAIGVSYLTSYVLRHTWATLADDLEVPDRTIAKSLGHGKKTVTDVYINFDRKKIDKANRSVIDFVLEKSGAD
jgi:integrase